MRQGAGRLPLRWRRSRGNNLVYVISSEAGVEDRVVTLKLNQQQLELIDRTIAKGVAPDREALIRLALRELAAKRAEAPR